jgi:hypothetical protein
MDRTATVLARTKPQDLTIGDCREGWFTAVAWCDRNCHGRYLALDKLEKWSDRKVLDLMREGVVVCVKCRRPAVHISIGSSERANEILTWRLGDDAMPRPAAG